ncbi:hypothetical protein EV424DRAFT_1345211 [Suillus variegatus]|nr:hypothetical protein EV424DRAFT_1345211 [Suillus variegatus]
MCLAGFENEKPVRCVIAAWRVILAWYYNITSDQRSASNTWLNQNIHIHTRGAHGHRLNSGSSSTGYHLPRTSLIVPIYYIVTTGLDGGMVTLAIYTLNFFYPGILVKKDNPTTHASQQSIAEEASSTKT